MIRRKNIWKSLQNTDHFVEVLMYYHTALGTLFLAVSLPQEMDGFQTVLQSIIWLAQHPWRECKITAWTAHFKRSLKWSGRQGVLFDCDWMRWMQLFLVNTVPVDNLAPDGIRTWADTALTTRQRPSARPQLVALQPALCLLMIVSRHLHWDTFPATEKHSTTLLAMKRSEWR